MKKKMFILITSIVLTISAGCGSAQILSEQDLAQNSNSGYSMFIKIENTLYYDIVYHQNTKVMYAISRGPYNQGTFTVLLDADGMPMLYEK